MMRMLTECLRVWRGAVTSTTSAPLRKAEVVLLALLAALALVLTWYMESPPGIVFASAVCLPLGIAAMLLWLRFISGAVRQNSPANAALVPRLNRRVRQSAVLAFCAAMLPVSLGAMLVPHGPGFIALSAASMLLLSLSRGGHPEAVAVFIAVDVALVWGAPPLWRFLMQPSVLALCYALIFLLGWYALSTVFPSSGERHVRLYQRQRRLIAQGASMQAHAKGNQGSGACRPLYRRMLARDIAGRKAQHLLLHALGPGGHRHDWMLPVALLVGIASLGQLASHWLPLIGNFMVHSPAVMIVVLAPFGSAIRWAPKIDSTPSEQALVRLAPRAPSSMRFNRVLGRQLLRITLTEWLAGMLAVLGVSVWWGASPATLMRELALICGALALAGAPLRNLAQTRDGPTWQAYVQGVVVLLLAVGGFASAGRPWLWAALTSATVIVSYLIVSARWRTLMAAPVAFPAGRMG